jgi:hypothetical protein
MSASVPFHFTTAASTNLQPVRAGQTANLKGLSVANVATAMFIKLFWYTPTGTNQGPTLGTTIPNLTIPVPANTLALGPIASWPDGITGEGQLWVAVTGAAADSDSSVAAAGAVITLLVE